jgi:small subunit ribosomal protein S8
MSMQDPIADMITRINNASLMKKATVKMPASQLKAAIAQTLKDEGYIAEFNVSQTGAHKTLEIQLKYFEGKAVISELKRVSKPGRRQYRAVQDLPKVIGGYGVAIVSTSKGIMSDAKARQQNIGGEILCYVF